MAEDLHASEIKAKKIRRPSDNKKGGNRDQMLQWEEEVCPRREVLDFGRRKLLDMFCFACPGRKCHASLDPLLGYMGERFVALLLLPLTFLFIVSWALSLLLSALM